jgi:hypothetical protein
MLVGSMILPDQSVRTEYGVRGTDYKIWHILREYRVLQTLDFEGHLQTCAMDFSRSSTRSAHPTSSQKNVELISTHAFRQGLMVRIQNYLFKNFPAPKV